MNYSKRSILTLLMLSSLSACHSGQTTGQSLSTQHSQQNIKPSVATIFDTLNNATVAELEIMYEKYTKSLAKEDIDGLIYYTDNSKQITKSKPDIKGRINIYNDASLNSQYKLKKIITLLAIFMQEHPDCKIFRFKHVNFPEYQQSSIAPRIKYEQFGYRPVWIIDAEDGSVADLHQITDNQITIYFAADASESEIKTTLEKLDQFLLQAKQDSENIDFGFDKQIGKFTSWRNEKITSDGQDFSNLTQSALKQFKEFLTKQLLNEQEIASLYDMVREYDSLSGEMQEYVRNIIVAKERQPIIPAQEVVAQDITCYNSAKEPLLYLRVSDFRNTPIITYAGEKWDGMVTNTSYNEAMELTYAFNFSRSTNIRKKYSTEKYFGSEEFLSFAVKPDGRWYFSSISIYEESLSLSGEYCEFDSD